MYKLLTIEDTVRVPPNRFSEKLEDVVLDILKKSYGGVTDKDVGMVLVITKVLDISIGRVIMGDGASYHDVTFEALVYKPEINEIVFGEVVEIVEFGAFVRLGPVDGLVHVSQVMNDFVGYDKKKGVLYGKESKRTLKEGDKVRARIVTVSLKRGAKAGKIGLTMRQPGLGKLEWIEEAEKEAKA
ncbi:MAG: DNA-directed RNA polymerase subunit E' [Candidatus Hadarchaeum yellowstonense]|uniref:DNA-directed RNA polymerase subunit Rpo7 n=1 Tax=Hadarchaeum yellowstonense TaxID=1776334 RepID=A0A147JWQ9_HADYE|nr:MAG: DNA-directed RNA polymerase subunit E' [Candidatus Hadarchaeum yellowstonense]